MATHEEIKDQYLCAHVIAPNYSGVVKVSDYGPEFKSQLGPFST